MTASFLNGFKISDIDQIILALVLRCGIIFVQKNWSVQPCLYQIQRHSLNINLSFFMNYKWFFERVWLTCHLSLVWFSRRKERGKEL